MCECLPDAALAKADGNTLADFPTFLTSGLHSHIFTFAYLHINFTRFATYLPGSQPLP